MTSIAKFFITTIFVSLLNFTPSAFAIDFGTQRDSNKRNAKFIESKSNGAKRLKNQKPPQESPIVCRLCNTEYDENVHYPKPLLCGHSFGAPCLEKYYGEKHFSQPTWVLWKPREINCPKCEKLIALPEGQIKNIALLHAMRANKEEKSPFLDGWTYISCVPTAPVAEENSLGPQKETLAAPTNPFVEGQDAKPVVLQVEFHNKQGQQLRIKDQLVESVAAYTWAIKSHGLLAKLPGDKANQKEKIGGWTFAQPGFLFKDLEQPIAVKFLKKGVEFFEALLVRAKEESKSEKECNLIRLDYMITKLHYLEAKRKWKLIDSYQADIEMQELEEFFSKESNKTPQRQAQLMFVKSKIREAKGDSAGALADVVQAKEQPVLGSEVVTMNLIRLLADKAEKGGGISSSELLQTSYNALEWKDAFKQIRKRTHNRGDVFSMARGFFDLGRIARSFGFQEKALELTSRAVDVMVKLEAEFHGAERIGAFQGLLMAFDDPHAEFHYVLPEWVAQAKAALAELTAELAVKEEIAQAAAVELSFDESIEQHKVFEADMAKFLVAFDQAQATPAEEPSFDESIKQYEAFVAEIPPFLVAHDRAQENLLIESIFEEI